MHGVYMFVSLCMRVNCWAPTKKDLQTRFRTETASPVLPDSHSVPMKLALLWLFWSLPSASGWGWGGVAFLRKKRLRKDSQTPNTAATSKKLFFSDLAFL